jgi:hypothetical protein
MANNNEFKKLFHGLLPRKHVAYTEPAEMRSWAHGNERKFLESAAKSAEDPNSAFSWRKIALQGGVFGLQ